jgi:diaminopimelate decarboxylase
MIDTQHFLNAVAKFGTPLYIYDANSIASQYQKLKSSFSSVNTKIFYACKALTNINILAHINSLGAGIDCSSINEVKLALYANVANENILYTSNSIAFEEICEAAKLGVHINIDSISNLIKFGEKFGNSYPVGIRMRPNIMAGGNLKVSTGHDKSKFGIPLQQLHIVENIVATYNLQVTCLHIHTGSEIVDNDVWIEALQILIDILPKFKHIKHLDLGGGFKVAYSNAEKETDIETLAKKIEQVLQVNCIDKKIEIWLEPGKFLVVKSGYLLSKVVVVKDNDNEVLVGIDTGFNHLIRPMFYDAFHTIKNISNASGIVKKYTIVGNLCETDTFAIDREILEINEGDILCFENAGAYGFEMSSNYNSRYKPAEVLLKNNQLQLIRTRSNFDDLLKNQIEL